MNIHEIAYHRNGVSGEGFRVVRFSCDEGSNMVGIVFEGRGRVAVLDADKTAAGNIAFAMGNSWRGDHYEDDLREGIEAQEKALREADAARTPLDTAIQAHDKGLDKVALV